MLSFFIVLVMLANMLGASFEDPTEWESFHVGIAQTACEVAEGEATNIQLSERLIYALTAWTGYIEFEGGGDQMELAAVLIQVLLADMREQSATILEHAESIRESGGLAALYEMYECVGEIIGNIADEYATLLGE